MVLMQRAACGMRKPAAPCLAPLQGKLPDGGKSVELETCIAATSSC